MKTSRTSLVVAALTCLICLSAPVHSVAQTAGQETIYRQALPMYADDSGAPLDVDIVGSGSYPECSWQKIEYTGKADRVPGLLFLPVGSVKTKPIPCLLLLHGLGGSKDQLVPVARFLTSIGYAVWAIDDADSGERAAPGHPFPEYASLQDLTTGVTSDTVTTIVDLRRGVDYLESRPEIDPHRIGLLGFSLGALLGAVLGGVEPRLDAVILVSGGGNLGQIMVDEAKSNVAFGRIYQPLLASADPVQLEGQLADIDPINFVAHISPKPLLMEHGRLDKIISPGSAAALYDAAAEPKAIDWYPDVGHIPPALDLYPAISIFLDKYLPLPGR